MSESKRAKTLREAIDACSIIIDAVDWLDEKVKADVPTVYRYSMSIPLTAEMRGGAKRTQVILEHRLGRALHTPEPGLMERLLKAKCDGR